MAHSTNSLSQSGFFLQKKEEADSQSDDETPVKPVIFAKDSSDDDMPPLEDAPSHGSLSESSDDDMPPLVEAPLPPDFEETPLSRRFVGTANRILSEKFSHHPTNMEVLEQAAMLARLRQEVQLAQLKLQTLKEAEEEVKTRLGLGNIFLLTKEEAQNKMKIIYELLKKQDKLQIVDVTSASNPAAIYLGGGYYISILGPMRSGKSLELIRQTRRFKVAKKKILVVKHTLDEQDRFVFDKQTNTLALTSSSHVISRDGVSEPCLLLKSLSKVCEPEILNAYDGLAIDEGQFFPDIYLGVLFWLNAGKLVITSALDGNFRAQPFGDLVKMIPWATEVIKCRAVCAVCSAMDAAFSYRLSDSKEEIETGDSNYEARCYRCYENPGKEQ